MLEAEQAEARLKGGEERPLLGVPIALKDSTDLAGELTTFGTDGFSDPAPADSEMVRRSRAAGAIVIGKTHLPELAICGFTESATWGISRNPWDLQRSPGGSSGVARRRSPPAWWRSPRPQMGRDRSAFRLPAAGCLGSSRSAQGLACS